MTESNMKIAYPIQIKKEKLSTLTRSIALVLCVLQGCFLIYDPSCCGEFDPDNRYDYYLGYFLLAFSVYGFFDILRTHGKEPRSLWIHKDRFEYDSDFVFYNIYFLQIESMAFFDVGGEKGLLVIKVENKSEVIRNQRSLAARMYLNMGQLFYETPVLLQANNFEISSDALKETLEMHWKNSAPLFL